jgi:flagellar basal-body rod protein FlgC
MKIDSNMFDTIDIAVSGLKAHGKQMEVIGSNLVNSRTTDAGNGQPYRRLEAILKTETDGITGVEIGDILEDKADFHRVPASPGDPRADEDGFILMPNVNLPTEMINLNLASRAYQANAAILKRYQRMVESSLELLK